MILPKHLKKKVCKASENTKTTRQQYDTGLLRCVLPTALTTVPQNRWHKESSTLKTLIHLSASGNTKCKTKPERILTPTLPFLSLSLPRTATPTRGYHARKPLSLMAPRWSPKKINISSFNATPWTSELFEGAVGQYPRSCTRSWLLNRLDFMSAPCMSWAPHRNELVENVFLCVPETNSAYIPWRLMWIVTQQIPKYSSVKREGEKGPIVHRSTTASNLRWVFIFGRVLLRQPALQLYHKTTFTCCLLWL